MGAVVGVVLLPLLFVWLSDLADRAAAQGMELAAGRVAAAGADTTDPDRLDALAAQSFARIRVIAPDGQIVEDKDHEGLPMLDGVAAWLFFGPQPPSFSEADASLPPLSERPEVTSLGTACVRADPGPVLLCSAARKRPDGSIVHVEIGSRRAIRALYDVRYPFIKLTFYMALVGVALGIWLDRRMVAPVIGLRDQLRRRKTDVIAVEHTRPDEIGELADAFNELVRALDGRNRANAAFMADLAHELKNPVAAVRVASEALSGGKPVDEERAKRLGTVLLDATKRMDAVVTQFLEIARAEAGLKEEERVPVDLVQLARGIGEAATARGGPAVVVTGEAPKVHAVPHAADTVLRNLIDNACAFAASRVEVAVGVADDGRSVVVTVKDDGPGIDPADLPHVFERFYTKRKDGKGTGLGLALVKATVEAHGGTVTVASGKGSGATFTVSLPSGK